MRVMEESIIENREPLDARSARQKNALSLRSQRRLWGGWWTIREIQRDRLIPPTRRGNAARHVHLGRAGSAERFRSGRHGAHAPFQRLSRTLAASARELRQRGCDRARPPYEAP